MLVLWKTWMNDEFIDHVIIDICAKSFKLLGSETDEKLIQCDTTDEFMGVLKVCNEYLPPDRIRNANLSLSNQ